MKLVICICTYNRNLGLFRCLKSINNLYRVPNIKIEVVVVDNAIKYPSFKLVKKINPKFICFFDDDCVVDRFWLKNVFKIIKSTNAEIVTGPQIPLKKKEA